MVAVNKKVQDDSYEGQINHEHQPYKKVLCTCDNLIQNSLDVDFKNNQFMELDENDEKKKDLCHSPTFESGE